MDSDQRDENLLLVNGGPLSRAGSSPKLKKVCRKGAQCLMESKHAKRAQMFLTGALENSLALLLKNYLHLYFYPTFRSI